MFVEFTVEPNGFYALTSRSNINNNIDKITNDSKAEAFVNAGENNHDINKMNSVESIRSVTKGIDRSKPNKNEQQWIEEVIKIH